MIKYNFKCTYTDGSKEKYIELDFDDWADYKEFTEMELSDKLNLLSSEEVEFLLED